MLKKRSVSDMNKDICPECARVLPEDNGKPKVKLIEGKWRRYCKECEWYERP